MNAPGKNGPLIIYSLTFLLVVCSRVLCLHWCISQPIFVFTPGYGTEDYSFVIIVLTVYFFASAYVSCHSSFLLFSLLASSLQER